MKILLFLKNKYLITIAVFTAWLFFFDKNDVFSQIDRHREVKKLEAEENYFKTEIAKNKKEENELKSNPKLLEKFAREHFLMKKDNEDIFILVQDSTGKK